MNNVKNEDFIDNSLQINATAFSIPPLAPSTFVTASNTVSFSQTVFSAGTDNERQLQRLQQLDICDEKYNLSSKLAEAPGFNYLSAPWITDYAIKRLNSEISFGKGRTMTIAQLLSAVIATARESGCSLDSEGICIVGRDPISNVDLEWVEDLFREAKAIVPDADQAFSETLCKNLKKPTLDVDYRVVASQATWDQVNSIKKSLYLKLSELLPECDSKSNQERIDYVQNSRVLGGFWINRYTENGEKTENGFIFSGIKGLSPDQLDTDFSCGNKFIDTLFSKTNFQVIIAPESICLNKKGSIDTSKLKTYVKSSGCNVLKALFEQGYGIIAERPDSHYNDQAAAAYFKEILRNGSCNDVNLLKKLANRQAQEDYKLGFSAYKGVVKVANRVAPNSSVIQVATAMMQEFALLKVFNVQIYRQINRMWNLISEASESHPLMELRAKYPLRFIITPWMFAGLTKLGLQPSTAEASKDSNVSLISFEGQPALQLKLDDNANAYVQFKLHLQSLCDALNDFIMQFIPKKTLDTFLEETLNVISSSNLLKKNANEDVSILHNDRRIWNSFNADDALKHTQLWLNQKHPYYHLCAAALLYAHWEAYKDEKIRKYLCLYVLPRLAAVSHQKLTDLVNTIYSEFSSEFELLKVIDPRVKQISLDPQAVDHNKNEIKKITEENPISMQMEESQLQPQEELDPISILIEKLTQENISEEQFENEARKEIEEFIKKENVSRREFQVYIRLLEALPVDQKKLRINLAEKLLEHLNAKNYKVSITEKQRATVLLVTELLEGEDRSDLTAKQSMNILCSLKHLKNDNFSENFNLLKLVNERMTDLLSPIADNVESLTEVAFALEPHLGFFQQEEKNYQHLIDALFDSLSGQNQKAIVRLLTNLQPLMNKQQLSKSAYQIFTKVPTLNFLLLQKWMSLLSSDELSDEILLVCWEKASYLIDVQSDIPSSLLFVLKKLSLQTISEITDEKRLLKLVQECHQQQLLSFEEALAFSKKVSCEIILLEKLQELLEEKKIESLEVAQHVLNIIHDNPSVKYRFQETLLLPLFHELVAVNELKAIEMAIEIAGLVQVNKLNASQRKIWNRHIQSCMAFISEDQKEKHEKMKALLVFTGRQQQLILINALKNEAALQNLQHLQNYKQRLSEKDVSIYVKASISCFKQDDAEKTLELVFNDPQDVQLELCKHWLENAKPSNQLREKALEWLLEEKINTLKDSEICWQIAQYCLKTASSNDVSWSLFHRFRNVLLANHVALLDSTFLNGIFSKASPHVKNKIFQKASKWKDLSEKMQTFLAENDPLTVEDVIKEQPISLRRVYTRCQRKKGVLNASTWEFIISELALQQEQDPYAENLYKLWKKSIQNKQALATYLEKSPQISRDILVCAIKYKDDALFKESHSVLDKVLNVFKEDIQQCKVWKLYLDYIAYSLDMLTENEKMDKLLSLCLASNGKKQLIDLFIRKISLMKGNKKNDQAKVRSLLLERLINLIACSEKGEYDYSDKQIRKVFNLLTTNFKLFPIQHMSLKGRESAILFLYSSPEYPKKEYYLDYIAWVFSSEILESSKASLNAKYNLLDIIRPLLKFYKKNQSMNKFASDCNKIKITAHNKQTSLAVHIGSTLLKVYRDLSIDPYELIELLLIDPSGNIWFPHQRKNQIAESLILYNKIVKQEKSEIEKASIIKIIENNCHLPAGLGMAIVEEFEKISLITVRQRAYMFFNCRLSSYPEIFSKIKNIGLDKQFSMEDRAKEIVKLVKESLIKEIVYINDTMSKCSNAFDNQGSDDYFKPLVQNVFELYTVFESKESCYNELNKIIKRFRDGKIIDYSFEVKSGNFMKEVYYAQLHIYLAGYLRDYITNFKKMSSKDKKDICDLILKLFNDFFISQSQLHVNDQMKGPANEYVTCFVELLIELQRGNVDAKTKNTLLNYYDKIKNEPQYIALDAYPLLPIYLHDIYGNENIALNNDAKYWMGNTRYKRLIEKMKQ